MEMFNHEVLEMADVQRLWESFFATAIRPATCNWREITESLRTPGNPPRERYTTHPEVPPP
jgi:hypothetical protein